MGDAASILQQGTALGNITSWISKDKTVTKLWWNSGKVLNFKMVCQHSEGSTSRGLWYGDDSLDSPTQLLFFELVAIFITTQALHCLFHRLRQSVTISQIVAGIIIGPSLLTHDKQIGLRLFPSPAFFVLKTLSNFGFMLHLFVHGVKIDIVSMKMHVKTRATFIGVISTIISLVFGAVALFIVRQIGALEAHLSNGVSFLVVMNSFTFFMVTSSYLNDLKFSNTEMGRLAAFSSLVGDVIALSTNSIFFNLQMPNDHSQQRVYSWFSLINILLYYFVMFFVFRPLVIRIVRRTGQDGMVMPESHFVLVLSIVLVVWFWGECLGQKFTTFLFGLSLPDGPPLGSVLVQKLEMFTSSFFLPVFCTVSGLRTNVYSLTSGSLWTIELLLIVGHMSKFLGSIMASVLVEVPFRDAVALACIMSCKGVLEMSTYGYMKDQMLLNEELFSLAIINMVVITGVAFPLAQSIYDPSTRYRSFRRRMVLRATDDGCELHVLVCIHKEDNVPGIINLLDISKSETTSPMAVSTLQLMQLEGSSLPTLSSLQKYKKSGTNTAQLDHVANAFGQLGRHSQGYVRAHHLVCITPYNEMHNDICTVAHDKAVNLVVLPFHKQWGIDGRVESFSAPIRDVNRRMLKKSPCSVAIFINRSSWTNMSSNPVLKEGFIYQIAVLFIGGPDDQEVLAFVARTAEHPSVQLHVIWLRPEQQWSGVQHGGEDLEAIQEMKRRFGGNERVSITEQHVSDGMGTTKAVLSLQSADLFVVGRYHEPDCPAIYGLMDWSENPELGILGDMLTCSDFRFSLLVIQQQPASSFGYGGSKLDKEESFGSLVSTPRSFQSLPSLRK